MIDVFRDHEKRMAEESNNIERSSHLPHRSPNPLPRHPGRIGPPAPGSKIPSLHHPPSVPMQLASNVMVVPPQQITGSSSQQLFLSSNHSHKRLAVAHPIMRQNPSYSPNLAKAPPPQRARAKPPAGPGSSSQESPLDLSTPLDLSVKRKDIGDPEDIFQQSASKKLKYLDSANKRGDGHQLAGGVSGILSKPPPIYPGLQRSEQHRLMRQQRKVQPIVQMSQSYDPSVPPKHFQPRRSMTKEEEVKLKFARRAFAMQSSMLLHGKNAPPKDPQLPVKRVQAAVPPLVTASTSGPAWPLRDHVSTSFAQQLSDHDRVLNEEKKRRLLARAAAMGIPVDQEATKARGGSLQWTPQLIKENGTVDAEMEEALRKMMVRSYQQQRQSAKPVTPLDHAAIAELEKRQAYNEYVSKQLLIHRLQQQTQQLARLQELRPPAADSPRMSLGRPLERNPSSSVSPHLLLGQLHESRPSSSASPHIPLARPHERPSSSASPHIPLARPHEPRPPTSASPHMSLARPHKPRPSTSASPHMSVARPHEPRPSSSASPLMPQARLHDSRPSSSGSQNVSLARSHESSPSSSVSPHMPPAARVYEPSPSISPRQPSRHPSPQREKQDILKRRHLYEMQTAYHHPDLPRSPPVLEAIDSKMKLVQGVGTNSGPQYRLSLKDLDHRQNAPSLLRHEKHKAEPKPMKTYQYRAPDTKAKRVRDYLQEYNKIFGDGLEQAMSSQSSRLSVDPMASAKDGHTRQTVQADITSLGLTASRGPISQGMPHPISKLTLPPSILPVSSQPRAGPPLLTPSEPLSSGERKEPSTDIHKIGDIRSRSAAGVSQLLPTASSDDPGSHEARQLDSPDTKGSQILTGINPAFSKIFSDHIRQRTHPLHRNHGVKHTKGFHLNIKEVIAREISKCIDEDYPKASEVIDLTNESSEGSATPPEGSGRVGSPQAIQPTPVVIENLKHDHVVRDPPVEIHRNAPPPLIKAPEAVPAGFLPLISSSVITSGTVTSSEPFAVAIKKCGLMTNVALPKIPPLELTPGVADIVKPEMDKVQPETFKVKPETFKVKPEMDKVKFETDKRCTVGKRESCGKILHEMAVRKNKEQKTKREQSKNLESFKVERKPSTGESFKSRAVFKSLETSKCRKVIKGEHGVKRRKVLKTVEDFINEATLRNVGEFEFTDEDNTTVGGVDCRKMNKNFLPRKGCVSLTSWKAPPPKPSLDTAAAVIKSVSYDPRRKVLAALSEQKPDPTSLDKKDASDQAVMSNDEEPEADNFPDTKIVARADQDDEDCKLPDQLFEGDDEETPSQVATATVKQGPRPEAETAVAPKEEPLPIKTLGTPAVETPEPEENDDDDDGDSLEEEVATPRPRRKRRRRVRRYYQIITRRTSARRGTKRKPPQSRRSPSSTNKSKHEEPCLPLQVRTRNSEGRRRLAAMASSYHRDTRYEQEIEKEQQKVMERRQRRRRVVVRTQRSSPSDSGGLPLTPSPETGTPVMDGVRRRRCKAVTSYLTEIKRSNGQIVDSELVDGEHGVLGPNMELKVRIQRKNLTGKFHCEEDSWQVVLEGDRPLTAQKPKACRSMTFGDDSSPSSSVTSRSKRLPARAKRRNRRRNTAVRRRLLEERVLLDDTRASAPPVPKELKRLAVNKKLGETLLHKAARLGHDEAALYYIDYCTHDLNAKDNAGYTPLHECCVNGRLNVAKHMIAKGADVNGSAADGTRPVHDAIDNEKVELARLLLAHGGDPLIATYSGRTTRKLARSQETKALVYGYLKDINGRLLAAEEELDDLQKVNFNIKFHSSVQSADDIANSGVDYMSGAPSPGPDEEFMFELSDEPMLPSISMYLEEPKKYSNWLLLTDVLQRLCMTRADFMYSHRDVPIYSIKKSQLHSAALGQSHTKAAMTKTASKTLEFIELNDHIRRILGTEVEYIT